MIIKVVFLVQRRPHKTVPPIPFRRIVYSGVTVTLLAHHNHLPGILAMLYGTICALALASHAKTVFTDPGAIPQTAVPRPTTPSKRMHAMCSHCQTYKPPLAHHCRICNRCIAKMDHHCPWMNNCVGIGNLSEYGSRIVLSVRLVTVVTILVSLYYFVSEFPHQSILFSFLHTLGLVLPLHYLSLHGTTFSAPPNRAHFHWY